MRILIVSDAWLPQTNGVVNTLVQTCACLTAAGHEVKVVTPDGFRTFPCPTYPEIRIAVRPYAMVAQQIDAFAPDALHIATEGPLGFAARRYCVRHGRAFTTSYHTQFPQYLRSRAPIPLALSYAALRWFHGAARHCMVSTRSVHEQLASRGFHNLARWQRGVDTALFRPRDKTFLDLPRPLAAYVGRISVEKNVAAFLAMPWAGGKLVIGDGPERLRLQSRYPAATFVGFRFGEDLARHLAAADVMVFPSRTDTFGLVNLEAMACGVPVAAYPVAGPIDVIDHGVTGMLDANLASAALSALSLDPEDCRRRALRSDWTTCAREFQNNLVNFRRSALPAAHAASVNVHEARPGVIADSAPGQRERQFV
ncbi:MAG: glycosyltransferase family 1 protein [Pseudomonadota bacterium]